MEESYVHSSFAQFHRWPQKRRGTVPAGLTKEKALTGRLALCTYEESQPQIRPEEIKIERINPAHSFQTFQSYEKELVDFLIEDALDNQKKQISVTYLWFLKGELVGYLTLLNDRINLEGELKDIFREKGIGYHSLPSLKVGRLCVDDRFLRRGLGTLMLAFAVKIANHIFLDYAGCRFIVLDAKRNPQNDSLHFYKKAGFEELKQRKKGTTPMYLDLVNNTKFHF